jgi:hypothetical protein
MCRDPLYWFGGFKLGGYQVVAKSGDMDCEPVLISLSFGLLIQQIYCLATI